MAVTTASPAIDDERSVATSGAPPSARSRGRVTSASTSSGASPGASTCTSTMGGANSGKTSSGAVRLGVVRSEEHTSELQSRLHLVCRLLLEKKKMIVYHYLSGQLHTDTQY